MFDYKDKELNYSKIRAYQSCPTLYKYKYVEGKREGLTAGGSLGVSLHRTLEMYHEEGNKDELILDYYNDCWIAGGYKNAQEQNEYFLKGKQILANFLALQKKCKGTVKYIEKEFIISHQEWIIRGKIDRVDKFADDSFDVIDYKTGLEMDKTYDVKDSLQLAIYTLGARKAWNMKKGKSSLWLLAFSEIISTDFKDFDDNKTLETITSVGKKILAEEFYPNTEHCEHCGFKNRCPYSTSSSS
ncbi:MAG: PD-(D/E)XK nuclease family protein [Elusimicrobiaceae bacterium]|nr:PD-(D/E)XK nuclease family protein [Elusimicrobiaceae bacterium]MBT6715030.1 PD-(D/E)XK nuclease family protein [Elusimicrobiaceae bacterium]